jgi:hypothetical protein
VAEWLRNGLQNRVPRFNSGRGLQTFPTALNPHVWAYLKSLESALAAFKPEPPLLYALAREPEALFPGSSAVEQPAVNRLVAGSNPARGAKLNQVVKPVY